MVPARTIDPTGRLLSGAALLLLATSAGARSDAVEHLAEAVRIPTVSYQQRERIDAAQFERFLGFLQDTWPLVFERLESERVAGFSLLLRWPGGDPDLPPVLFDAHYDVVPIDPQKLEQWAHPPFAGVVADGYLWGRGTLDNKSAVVANLESLQRLISTGFQPRRTLLFSLSHDEEIGGESGAAGLAARIGKRYGRLAYMIGEGGLLVDGYPLLPDGRIAMIGLAEKTYVTMTLSATGPGGHSSFPHSDNPAVRVASAVQRLHDTPFEPKLVPPVSDMLRAFAPHVGGLRGVLLKHQWLGRRLLLANLASEPTGNAMVRTTTAITMLDAGEKENVLPQTASAKINFRLLPGDTVEALERRVRRIVDDSAVDITLGEWGRSPPISRVDGPGYATVKGAIESVDPDVVVVPGLVIATTDTRHYAGLTDHIYRFHPYRIHLDDAGTIHSRNERIAVDAIDQAVDFAEAMIRAAGEDDQDAASPTTSSP